MNDTGIREKYEQLTRLLIQKEMTITTMESITSGQIASLITDTEGASAILKGAFVTYSNEAKIRQGVPSEVIDAFGVYSKETACAMAKACRAAYKADIGIGVTGSAGNVDPNNADSVPGQVYYALDIRGELLSYALELPPFPARYAYKMCVAGEIVDTLLEKLKA